MWWHTYNLKPILRNFSSQGNAENDQVKPKQIKDAGWQPSNKTFCQLEEVEMCHLFLFAAGSGQLMVKNNLSTKFTIWVPNFSDELHLRRP